MAIGGYSSGLEPGFRVTRTSSGQYDLKMWGKMPIGWVANLTGGMAGTGISIQRGTVQKVDGMAWQAGFEMTPLSLDAAPERIDFLGLASRVSGSAATAGFSLDSFILREPSAPRQPLYLEVRAPDQKGFLGALLGRLAFFSLFPEEMAIETRDNHVHDRFWLRSPGGQSPSAEVAVVLRKALAARTGC